MAIHHHRGVLPGRQDGAPTRRRVLTRLAATSIGWLTGCTPFGKSADDIGATPLAFARDGDLWLISPSGGTPRRLTSVPDGGSARDPAWSPDGTTLLYAYTPPLSQARSGEATFSLPVADIYRLPVAAGEGAPFIRHQGKAEQLEHPVWSPDGRWVYCSFGRLLLDGNMVRGWEAGITRVPATGGRREVVLKDASYPTLTADGAQLACVREDTSGTTTLWIGDPNGRRGKTIIPAGAADVITAPRFSPDGTQIVYSALVPPEERPALAPATPSPALGYRRRGLAMLVPRPAHAAQQRHGLPRDLYLVNVDGSGLRRLTHLAEDDPAAAWSPDGARLFIGAGGGLYLLRLDGSPPTLLATPGGHGTVDWRRGEGV